MATRALVSSFRQNTTVATLSSFQERGDSSRSPAEGEYPSAWRRRDRHVQSVPTSRSSGCEQQLACGGGQRTFRRFAATLREARLRFDVSRRRCARRAYVSTFRGDVAAAAWRAAALSGRGGDISPAGGGTLGEARWRSRRGYHVALAPQPRSAGVCRRAPRRAFRTPLGAPRFRVAGGDLSAVSPFGSRQPSPGVVRWGNKVGSSRGRLWSV